MGRGMLIEVVQARLKKTSGAVENFLYREIELRESFVKPGWTSPAAPTMEEVMAIALTKAKEFDMGLGITFIEDSGEPTYKMNGPWNFSAAAHARHGVTKKD